MVESLTITIINITAKAAQDESVHQSSSTYHLNGSVTVASSLLYI